MLTRITYASASFLPNLILLNLPHIILYETMFSTRRELRLNVQVAIFFSTVNSDVIVGVTNKSARLHSKIIFKVSMK